MSKRDRYPTVTPSANWRDWRVTSFKVPVSPLEVIRDPDALSPGDPFRRESRQTTLRRSREGRFRRRVRKLAESGYVLITRESLPRLRADLLNTDAGRVESVRQFLERWGLLVLSDYYDVGFGTDDVAATREWLDSLQDFFRDPKERFPQLYEDLMKAGPRAWPSGTFTLAWGPAGLKPRVLSLGLLDALLMALPLWAEELPSRWCANERCNNGHPRLIPVPRPGQDYCTAACATAARVRRFKQRARVLRRLEAGDTDRMILTRYPTVDPADLRRRRREWQQGKRGRRQRAAAHQRSTGRRPKGARQ